MKKAPALFVAGMLAAMSPAVVHAASDGRSYVAANFALILDGQFAGWVHSFAGGNIHADVVEEPGSGPFTQKHAGQPRFEDITLRLGASMAPGVYAWIAQSWQKVHQRKNGAILACNHNYEVMSVREFDQALITETTLPALDANAKEPAFLQIKLSPEIIRYKLGDRRKVADTFGRNTQEPLSPSGFLLQIGDLPCKKVSKVESLTIKQGLAEEDAGTTRNSIKVPGRLEFPNVSISLDPGDFQPWLDYFDSFVIQGNQGTEQKKTGTLVYLNRNRTKELFSLGLFNLGIFKIGDDQPEAGEDAIRRIRVEMFSERMEFGHGGRAPE